MSSSTKGIIRTETKDILHVAHIAEQTIKELIRKEVPNFNLMKRGMSDEQKRDYDYPKTCANPGSGYVTVEFRHQGNFRALYIFGDTDSDNQEKFPGRSLCLSIGDYGIAFELVQAVLSRLTHLGECYYIRTSLSDEPPVRIEAPALTYVAAVQQGLASASTYRTWQDLFRATRPQQKNPAQFFGFTQEEMDQVLTDPSLRFAILDRYETEHKAAQKEQQSELATAE